MGEYNSTILFNSISLQVQSITPTKKQKTRKSVIGKTLTQVKIIGLNDQQWELKINGIITGTTSANLSTNRAAIEALDDVTKHQYDDGIHLGSFVVVPSSLIIKDVSDNANMKYDFNMDIVEW